MITSTTYRKRPVEIQAVEFPEGAAPGVAYNLADWCGGRFGTEIDPYIPDKVQYTVHIPTLEGTMTAREGDYIIRGVAGEFYPCRADIFHQTYEEVTPRNYRDNALDVAEKTIQHVFDDCPEGATANAVARNVIGALKESGDLAPDLGANTIKASIKGSYDQPNKAVIVVDLQNATTEDITLLYASLTSLITEGINAKLYGHEIDREEEK